MSIPQVCLSCGNHISTAHAPGCCYGTPEYAHLGWPKYLERAIVRDEDGVALMSAAHPAGHCRDDQDNATAIRRLLEYLEDEPDEKPLHNEANHPNSAAITLLTKRAAKLRREADGISLIESRAKRNFAADVLDGIIQELVD